MFTNFLPVRFTGQVVAGVLPYESAGHLEDLRSRLRESHVVVRDRNDVVCVPLAQGVEQIGERRVIASAAGDVLLQTRLLEECLRRILTVEWKYLLRREYPVRFVSRLAGKDLVEQASPLPFSFVRRRFSQTPEFTSELCRMGRSFLIGAIPFAQLVARRAGGVDLRVAHPESVSATGVFRATGLAPFLVASALDVAKGYVAIRVAGRDQSALAVHAGLVVAGHNWSPFMRGFGGRGITPATGALLGVHRWGATVVLAGPVIGYACRASGFGSFVSQLLLLPMALCSRERGRAWSLVSVLIPIWIKRMVGNRLEVGARVSVTRYLERLVYDREPDTHD